MWKDYSKSYIKNNRASGLSIMTAALTSSLFLSLLCSAAYNLWIYETEKVLLREGEWQSSPAYDVQNGTMPMLLMVYLGVLSVVVLSLVLIIRNSFEVSMNARIHQFGIFSSIGATPRQIRICLLQEAAVLSILPMILGSILGILVSYGAVEAVNHFAADVAGRHKGVFTCHPVVFLTVLLSSALTMLFSAWIPAGKLSKMTPLEAIRNTDSLPLKKRKHSWFLFRVFGVEGELAGNALKARRKSLRLSTISLTLSFLGFSVMLMFVTLADISTRYTYFERYQDVWDIMVTLRDTEITEFDLTEEVQSMSGVRDAAVYQKAEAVTLVPEELQSNELLTLGGLGTVAEFAKTEGQFQVSAPIVILDDASFLNFGSQIGVTPSLGGAIIYNQIWDSVHSNFRYPAYVPFVREDRRTTVLCRVDGKRRMEIPVLSYTQKVPALREEYQDYALVHFVSLTMWKKMAGQVGGAESDSYIRILSGKDAGPAGLNSLEREIENLVSPAYRMESENRVQERLSNDSLISGMKIILGGFCVLLSMIGIANLFSNTLGFLRQRKREFARYMSIGMTPREMRKIFVIEAFLTAAGPFLITVPFTVLFIQYAVKASCLEPEVFWAEAPVFPVLLFASAIAAFTALAYYIGGKRLLACDLSETLQNDTLI